MDLHEFAPVDRRATGGRDGRWFERFAEVCQDLPDRPWLGDERDRPDVAAAVGALRDRPRRVNHCGPECWWAGQAWTYSQGWKCVPAGRSWRWRSQPDGLSWHGGGMGSVRVGFRSPIWIRGILKSVAFSALCARKLAELAKPDVLSEVVCWQRLTTNFVVSSGLAKSSRLNSLIPGSLVRVQPGVLKSTGKPLLFSFQERGSFVAPTPILKNPQICTGRRGPW